MAYNVKITEYANGQLEVTTYKQGVYTMLEGESSYRADMIDKNADALAWRLRLMSLMKRPDKVVLYLELMMRSIVIIRLLKKFNVFIRILMKRLLNVRKSILSIVLLIVHVRHYICTLDNVNGNILLR